MTKRIEIFHINTPHYACSVVEGDDANPLEAMREALRLERKTGVSGWMIRDLRFPDVREYPAFISRFSRRESATT